MSIKEIILKREQLEKELKMRYSEFYFYNKRTCNWNTIDTSSNFEELVLYLDTNNTSTKLEDSFVERKLCKQFLKLKL